MTRDGFLYTSPSLRDGVTVYNGWAELRRLSKTTLRFKTMYKKPRQEYNQETGNYHPNSYTTYLKFLAALAII